MSTVNISVDELNRIMGAIEDLRKELHETKKIKNKNKGAILKPVPMHLYDKYPNEMNKMKTLIEQRDAINKQLNKDMTAICSEFRDLVKEIREENLSQNMLARVLGVKHHIVQSMIRNWK